MPPNNNDGLRGLLEEAVSLHRAGNLGAAEQKYREVLAIDKDQPDALSLLGQIVFQFGDPKEALAMMTRARTLRPTSPTIAFNLGRLHFEMRDWANAATMNEAAAKLAPTNPAPLCNQGIALVRLGRAADGEAALRKSLALSPDNAMSWSGLGLALARQDRRDEARAAFEKALALDPNLAEAKFNLGEILLGDMDFAAGWPLFAVRADVDRASFTTGGEIPAEIPMWQGEDLAGKTVLVWGEQGLGDQILFASLIPDLLRRAGRVVIACDPRLANVFSAAFPEVSVVSQEGYAGNIIAQLGVDTVIAAGSLGQLFRPDRGAFVGQAPFLAPNPSRVEELRARYKTWSGGLPVIGVSWRSSRQDIGSAKSVPMANWVSIFRDVRAAYVSLQYGDVAADIIDAERLGLVLREDREIDVAHDLAGQVDQIAAVDLVVSVSNTTVHVAGGLGKSVWNLAPLGAGRMWYWFTPDTPSTASLWYPSMRIFHQHKPGDWSDVISRVRTGLISAYSV